MLNAEGHWEKMDPYTHTTLCYCIQQIWLPIQFLEIHILVIVFVGHWKMENKHIVIQSRPADCGIYPHRPIPTNHNVTDWRKILCVSWFLIGITQNRSQYFVNCVGWQCGHKSQEMWNGRWVTLNTNQYIMICTYLWIVANKIWALILFMRLHL